MITQVLLLFACVCSQSVLSSHNVHLFTPYHGPLASPVVLKSGYLADTHEVAAAKRAHHETLEKQFHHGYHHEEVYEFSHDDHGQLKYHGPTAIPHVLHDGHIADTHEVAAARAEHFAAVAKSKIHGGYDHENYKSAHAGDNGYEHHSAPYHGPLSKPVVLKSGYLADTHEVAAAKRTQQATIEKQSHHGYHHEEDHEFSHDDHDHLKYHGPTAIPHVLHDGHIEDTHEVAAARAEHLAAVAKAKVHGGYHHEDDEDGYTGNQGHEHHTTPYHGPLAKPVLLKSGFLADTHEVTAAKKHHLQILHKADSHYNSY